MTRQTCGCCEWKYGKSITPIGVSKECMSPNAFNTECTCRNHYKCKCLCHTKPDPFAAMAEKIVYEWNKPGPTIKLIGQIAEVLRAVDREAVGRYLQARGSMPLEQQVQKLQEQDLLNVKRISELEDKIIAVDKEAYERGHSDGYKEAMKDQAER